MKLVSVILSVVFVFAGVKLIIKLIKWINNPWYYTHKPEGVGISFAGDPEAVPRNNDSGWENQWKGILLKAEGEPPYFIDFLSDEICMRRLLSVQTHYFVVRLGPGAVTFFAIRKMQGKNEESKLEKIIGPVTQDEIVKEIGKLQIGRDVTWI